MSALDALKLAKETGAKVRPKYWGAPAFVIDSSGFLREYFVGIEKSGDDTKISLGQILNHRDGSFIEWEIVPTDTQP